MTGLSTAQRSGRTWNPCSIRPIVAGKDPPPWAKQIRSRGRRSSTPPKISEQIASDVSAGIPTSHGSQYFDIRSLPSTSQGWTNTAAPSASAARKTGKSAGWSRFQSFTWLPI